MSILHGKVDRFSKLICGKCGSIRTEVHVYPDDDKELTWIRVDCGRCGAMLYYNGA